MIYLDYAATTPMGDDAIEAYNHAARNFYGNPSSLHDAGSDSNGLLEGARSLIANILGVHARGVRFTGSGSEASFLAITSLVRAYREKGNHLITSSVEHSSVRNTFNWLEQHGFEVTRLPVDRLGRTEPEELRKHLRDDTILVSIQHVNPETGTIQPLHEIGHLLSDHQAVFHSDIVQSFCKLPISPGEWGIQSCTVSAHKVHGPKGIGAAYINPGISWTPFLPGSTHENGFRPGTVDTPAAVAFAAAVRERSTGMNEKLTQAKRLKKLLAEKLQSQSGDTITLVGDTAYCSPYIAGFRVYGMEGQYAMLECSQRGLAISTGSACQVNEQKPSQTLLAMGRTEEEALGFIRLSLDTSTTETDIEQAVQILTDVVEKHLKRVEVD